MADNPGVGDLQSTLCGLSKLTRRSAAHPTRVFQRRVTPDKVLILGGIYPDQDPALVEPMAEKGTFSFPRRSNQAKWLDWSMLRTNDR